MSEIHLLQGDAAQVLTTLAEASIDLTVTSPPYDNLRAYKGYTFDFETIARELYRVTKPGGVVVWVVGDATINGSETGTSFRQALYFMSIGFNLHDTMIYKKAYPIPQYKVGRYTNEYEFMFVFSKGKPATVNYLMERCRSFGRIDTGYKGQRLPNGEHNTKAIKAVKEEKIRGNIWEYDQANEIDKLANHPAAFPESLANDHILSWSNEGDTVLDPMMGSGTTGKMAVLNNRNFVGIEIAAEYMPLAERRITDAQMQMALPI